MERNVDSGGPAQGVSEGKSIRGHSSTTLAKKVAAFYPFPKNPPETKLKSYGLMVLVEEISKQPSIDSVMWLLVLTLMKI